MPCSGEKILAILKPAFSSARREGLPVQVSAATDSDLIELAEVAAL
jgi:hypothetical protein